LEEDVSMMCMHLSNENLPFGGVGNSGIGNYHGKFGFEAFLIRNLFLKRQHGVNPILNIHLF
jgi:aldehyde dehydrogenase (NAD+)